MEYCAAGVDELVTICGVWCRWEGEVLMGVVRCLGSKKMDVSRKIRSMAWYPVLPFHRGRVLAIILPPVNNGTVATLLSVMMRKLEENQAKWTGGGSRDQSHTKIALRVAVVAWSEELSKEA